MTIKGRGQKLMNKCQWVMCPTPASYKLGLKTGLSMDYGPTCQAQPWLLLKHVQPHPGPTRTVVIIK